MSQNPFLRSRGVREGRQSAQALFLEIKRAIQNATKESFLVYEGIDGETGSCIERSLEEDKDVEGRCSRVCYNSYALVLHVSIMPGFIHDSHQPWLEKCFIQPNQMIMPPSLDMPTLAIEAGWSGSGAQLKRDMRLWVRGEGGGKSSGGRVRGWLEVYRPGPGGITLFPVPPTPQRIITVTQGQLFGAGIYAGRNPLDTFDLNLDDLRPIAILGMQKEGLRLAYIGRSKPIGNPP
ncbi:hypothetical protein V8E54_002294 [Elaphomyces granulatus]